MSRYDFQSGGAAFSDQIAQLLAQRKAEERQRLLDSLTVNADSRAQEAAQREQKDLEMRQQESMLRQSGEQQTQELQKLGALEAPLKMGEDPKARGYSPKDIEMLNRWGRLTKLPTPSVSTSESFTDTQGTPAEGSQAGPAAPAPAPPVEPRYGYVGTREEQEHDRRKMENAQLIGHLMQDPKKAEIAQFYKAIYDANDGMIPAEALNLLQPNSPLFINDEPSGTVTQHGTLPPNAHIVNRGYQPYGAYNTGNITTIGHTRDGLLIVQNHKTGKMEVDPDHIGPVAQDVDENPLGIPQEASRYHLTLLGALADDPTDVSMLNMVKNSALRLVPAAHADATVKRLVMLMLTDYNAYLQARAQTPVDEHSAQQFIQLKNMLIPPDVEQILKMEAASKVKTHTPPTGD